jgi:hypothetical protein
MSNTQYKAIARRFIEEIFNARKLEAAKNFVTPDIIYHGIAEEVWRISKSGWANISQHSQICRSQY